MSGSRKPITPTAIIPAGQPLPAPVSPPPPPPVPPVPPAVPDADPDWWRTGSGSSSPPPPLDVYVHVTVDVPAGGSLSVPDPDPGPRWWQRIRIGYNAGLLLLAFPLSGPWAWVLAKVRDEESLAGAWVMALGPLIVFAFADNIYRVAASGAHPDLWLPKIRAALARLLLWAAVIATTITLPITTLVFLMTGVRS